MGTTLSGKPLKLVDRFIYLGSNISTESNVNKVWNVGDRLSGTWKSNLCDKIKEDFFQSVAAPYYSMDAPHGR